MARGKQRSLSEYGEMQDMQRHDDSATTIERRPAWEVPRTRAETLYFQLRAKGMPKERGDDESYQRQQGLEGCCWETKDNC